LDLAVFYEDIYLILGGELMFSIHCVIIFGQKCRHNTCLRLAGSNNRALYTQHLLD
jgi:hypothetical protein